MKQEKDKELLLKDLSARLPYGVKVKSSRRRSLVTLSLDVMTDFHLGCSVKPYLRSLSSMTEEEKEELKTLFDAEEITSDSICYLEGGTLVEYLSRISYSFCSKIVDWLNAHHFDYRHLIEKNLAIEVTEENNPFHEDSMGIKYVKDYAFFLKRQMIEKACKWLKFNYTEYLNDTRIGIDIDEMVKDFKMDMKGE